MHDHTPILIGAGQITEPVPEDLSEASSYQSLAAKAALVALQDTGSTEAVNSIDTLVAVRTFMDSNPMERLTIGGPDNFPRAVAQRIGADPAYAVYSQVGGEAPQRLVNEFAEKLAQGQLDLVLLVGAEALANAKAIHKQKLRVNWSEKINGEIEDRGMQAGSLLSAQAMVHQVLLPMQYYALMETARRGTMELSAESYQQDMATTFSQLAAIAAENPLAVDRSGYSAEEITAVGPRNSQIVAPYTKRMMAKDRVNQAAALIMTTVGKARELGIAQEKWVFLEGYAQVHDRILLERSQLGKSAALRSALNGALKNAKLRVDDLDYFDIYSCFPIVVSETKDALGLKSDDARALTLTGGLPYFGGPGNNYSMHGIAEMITKLRQKPNTKGLVLANGGWLSKLAVGIYSSEPVDDWQPQSSYEWQAQVDAVPARQIAREPMGMARIIAYTVHYFQNFPVKAIIVGELDATGERFYATTPMADTDTVQEILAREAVGRSIYVTYDPKGNRFAFSQAQLDKFTKPPVRHFLETYKFCQVKREGKVLWVILNRPAVRNALHPPANDELEGVFNAFEADTALRVAIVTGAGEVAFSTGNDLKYMAEGNPMWISRTGFGGLTSRTKRTKPIIAAVNGQAMGGGMEMALAADMVVAAEHATFALPEVKVGLFAGAGGVQRLTRQIGYKKAMELLLTGRTMNAKEALDVGVVNYIVPGGQLLLKAEELARQVVMASPVGIHCTYRVLQETAHLADPDAAVTHPHTIFDELINSEDFWEGARAFAEKRPPKWTK